MANPTADNAENLEAGKILWAKFCKSCHGKLGEGDGPKAEDLDDSCGDLTTDEFHAQSDGVIYYKTTEGKDEMPNFTKKIPDDNDRWLLVHYMRTFK